MEVVAVIALSYDDLDDDDSDEDSDDDSDEDSYDDSDEVSYDDSDDDDSDEDLDDDSDEDSYDDSDEGSDDDSDECSTYVSLLVLLSSSSHEQWTVEMSVVKLSSLLLLFVLSLLSVLWLFEI